MNSRKIIEIIKRDITDLNYVIENIDDDNLTNAYINLCLSKSQSVYNGIETLKNIFDSRKIAKQNKSDENKKPIIPPKKEEKITPQPNDKREIIETPTEIDESLNINNEKSRITSTKNKLKYPLKNKIIPQNDSKDSTVEHPTEKTKFTPKKTEKDTMLYDALSSKMNIKNRFSEKKFNEIGYTLNPTSVEDINKIININDKFLFIRELFNGDKNKYTQIIKTLNSKKNINEAIDCIVENIKIEDKNTNETLEKFITAISWKYQ